MKEFRLLKAEEISCRVNQINDKGLTLLLYKDARVDMDILDETVGCMNWKKEYTRDNRNCIVSIWDEEKKEWISKEDTGTESNNEAEKGLASDSFKRACVNWGIGRCLYTAPFIWIDAKYVNMYENGKDKNGKIKWATKDSFKVSKIGYDENRNIIGLSIKNQKGVRVYLLAPHKEVKKDENNKQA